MDVFASFISQDACSLIICPTCSSASMWFATYVACFYLRKPCLNINRSFRQQSFTSWGRRFSSCCLQAHAQNNFLGREECKCNLNCTLQQTLNEWCLNFCSPATISTLLLIFLLSDSSHGEENTALLGSARPENLNFEDWLIEGLPLKSFPNDERLRRLLLPRTAR